MQGLSKRLENMALLQLRALSSPRGLSLPAWLASARPASTSPARYVRLRAAAASHTCALIPVSCAYGPSPQLFQPTLVPQNSFPALPLLG